MNARNKKSKNAAYKNRKNKLAAEQISLDTSSSEKDVVTAIRRDIKIGKEDLLKDAYGMAGLEEYLVGSHFEQLALVDDSYNEIGKKYYRKSCDKGHPLGQYAMALTYLQGSLGQPKDETLGVEIMSRAAKAGCGPALYNKGVWLMDGMQAKDFEKSKKMFHKALKDPVIKDFPFQHSRSLVRLGMLRMNGDGCNKSYSAALGHFRAAEVVESSDFITKTIKQLEILEKISGVEVQREADSRYRRFKVLMREIKYQTLGEWIALYRNCGFDWSVKANQEEAGVSLDHDGLVEWMERVGAIQSMPENYPSMNEPLPPLECERPECFVNEDVTGKKMKKCTECQAPYCGVNCQREDWPRHKPICNAVKVGINAELTPNDLKLLKQDNNLAEKLSKMGLSTEQIEEAKSYWKSLEDDCSSDPCNSSIPSSFEGYLEKGPGSMSRQEYTLVTRECRASAAAVGTSRSEDGNVASKVAQGQSSGRNNSKALKKQLAKLKENPDISYCLFTPSNSNADMGITLANPIGQIVFKTMWNKLIFLPWGAGAKSRLLWLVYDSLEASVDYKQKTMLRNQLMAEFGADPLECKNAEYEEVTENDVQDAILEM